jgi:hypothetical protein
LPGLHQGLNRRNGQDLVSQGEEGADWASAQRAPARLLAFTSQFAVGKIGLVIVDVNHLPTLRTGGLLEQRFFCRVSLSFHAGSSILSFTLKKTKRHDHP